MAKITGIVANSGEDFVDELSSTIVYKHASQIFAPTVSKLNESDSLVDNALGGALQTLQFGIMNSVIIGVTEYALSKTVLVGGAIYTFLKATNIARKTKGIIAGALGSIPFVGRGLGNVVRATGSFVSKDRELIAKMANDSSNNMSTVISQERQNQILMKQSQYRNKDKNIDRAVTIRNKSIDKNTAYFTHKTMTGTWVKNPYHKKLYETATGKPLSEIGVTWNQSFVDKLNSYSQFARTSSGQIVNQSKATLDLISSHKNA